MDASNAERDAWMMMVDMEEEEQGVSSSNRTGSIMGPVITAPVPAPPLLTRSSNVLYHYYVRASNKKRSRVDQSTIVVEENMAQLDLGEHDSGSGEDEENDEDETRFDEMVENSPYCFMCSGDEVQQMGVLEGQQETAMQAIQNLFDKYYPRMDDSFVWREIKQYYDLRVLRRGHIENARPWSLLCIQEHFTEHHPSILMLQKYTLRAVIQGMKTYGQRQVYSLAASSSAGIDAAPSAVDPTTTTMTTELDEKSMHGMGKFICFALRILSNQSLKQSSTSLRSVTNNNNNV